jgi:hypothetical protein
MNGIAQLQALYNSRVGRGVDSRDETSPAGQKSVEQMLLCWATWRYRYKYYDEPFLSKSFAGIEHNIVELGTQEPCLAASSFFTLKDVPVDEELVGTAINVLPISNTKTVVAFSYASQDRGTVHAALDRILNSEGDTQKYELSKLILSRISNVVLSPRHVAKWGPSRTKKISDAFVETVRTQRDVGDDAEFMLF